MPVVKCPYCNGKGKVNKKSCMSCGGTGSYFIPEKEKGLHTVDWESR